MFMNLKKVKQPIIWNRESNMKIMMGQEPLPSLHPLPKLLPPPPPGPPPGSGELASPQRVGSRPPFSSNLYI